MNIDSAESAVVFALLASLFFSVASVFFARYSRLTSSLWMNTMKALVCAGALILTLTLTGTWQLPSTNSLVALFISGAIGLGIGDLFLMMAFARMGASRTLLIFGFQPLLMALAGAVFFRQTLYAHQGLALLFFILCLVTLSLERYRQDGHWEYKGLLFAFLGVLLDSGGVILTRVAFEQTSSMDPLQANFYRLGGALGIYWMVSFFQPLDLRRNYLSLAVKDRQWVIFASLLGTFLSLALYLRALKFGHLAIISGIVLTGPLFSALLESLWQKKRPSAYQCFAFLCLISGMAVVFLKSPP